MFEGHGGAGRTFVKMCLRLGWSRVLLTAGQSGMRHGSTRLVAANALEATRVFPARVIAR